MIRVAFMKAVFRFKAGDKNTGSLTEPRELHGG